MSRNFSKLVVAASAGTLALFAPLSVNLGAFAPGGAGVAQVVRLNQACGQATDCAKALDRLCSTHNGNEEGWKCVQGCTNTPPVEQ